MATKTVTKIPCDIFFNSKSIRYKIVHRIPKKCLHCLKNAGNERSSIFNLFQEAGSKINVELSMRGKPLSSNRPNIVNGLMSKIISRTLAGHSHWANIKFKKMHKDVERSKIFGRISLEIINAVKENGPDTATNAKLDSIISRAKAAKMPKDSIESAIKSALRVGSEDKTSLLLEVRGPGRCGILLDLLSSNIKRSRPEINGILKKNGGVLCEEGSVSFMFKHKGVVTVENNISGTATQNMIEEAAILSGAESFHFDKSREGKPVIRFLCDVVDVRSVERNLAHEHSLNVITATEEQIAMNLVELSQDVMIKAEKLIERLSGHPDVIRIFDNIRYYQSSTLKIDQHQ